MTTDKTYGRTQDGRSVDSALIKELADEAEHGYSDEQLANHPRGRGRPPVAHPAKTVESVRMDVELKRDLLLRAAEEHVSVSELIRRALREYLRSA